MLQVGGGFARETSIKVPPYGVSLYVVQCFQAKLLSALQRIVVTSFSGSSSPRRVGAVDREDEGTIPSNVSNCVLVDMA